MTILLIVVILATTPILAANYMIRQTNQHEAYVIYQDHYYRVTGNLLDASKLGEEIFHVTRVGNWNLKKNGDSNHFVPSSPIYRVRGREDAIAVKSTMWGIFDSYIELERAEAVETVPKESIRGAKNDPVETSIALENAKNQVDTIYSFPENFERAMLNFVSLQDDHFPTLYYRVLEADVEQDGMTVQGFLFVHQYAKDKEIPAVSMFTPGYIREYVDETTLILKLDPDFVEPEAKESFLINDMKWSYYHDQLWQGERGNRYYEIQTQGAFTKDMMIDLLSHFQPDKRFH
jgi:hypothetical protein